MISFLNLADPVPLVRSPMLTKLARERSGEVSVILLPAPLPQAGEAGGGLFRGQRLDRPTPLTPSRLREGEPYFTPRYAWVPGPRAASPPAVPPPGAASARSEEHTSELQSLIRTPYAVFCLKTKTVYTPNNDASGYLISQSQLVVL